MPPVSKIVVRGLSKRFGSHEVLKSVDLDVAAGGNLFLFGLSGSGKTVLMRCLLGLDRPEAGSVEIDGQDTAHLGEAQREALMRRTGVLFQRSALFDSLSIWRNVSFGLMNTRHLKAHEAREIAIAKLAAVGLGADVADLLPADLSGGMQKRVALARAIANDPEILFLDNPTAGLDPIMTAIIDRLIIDCLKNLKATAITITHDIDSARRIATDAAMLADGRIAWSGPMSAIDAADNKDVARFLQSTALVRRTA